VAADLSWVVVRKWQGAHVVPLAFLCICNLLPAGSTDLALISWTLNSIGSWTWHDELKQQLQLQRLCHK
jgi:hypothetical protein